mgnify:CR=1 FL=1
MSKKILFFSIDRLGDFLVRSNVIKKISENYNNSEIICSEKNYKLISKQNYLNKVVEFNTKNKILNKFKFILLYFFKSYDSLIVFDGKNISILLLFLIRARFKFIFVYVKKGFFNNISTNFFLILLKLFNIRYDFIRSRVLIKDNNNKNYPEIYKNLKKYYTNINSQTYYINKIKKSKFKKFFENYLLMHLDEKYNDIFNIENNFEKSLIKFQKKVNKFIILTSFKNNFDYYKNLNFKKIDLKMLNSNLMEEHKILILEDLSLEDLQDLITNSHTNISCHSGFFIHTSLALNKKTIDILNKNDEIWYNNWIGVNYNYLIVYKSMFNNKVSIDKILNKLQDEIKKY